MILLPSRGRPGNVKRFLAAYRETKATEPGMILLDDDDAHNYWQAGIDLPAGWGFVAFEMGDGIVSLMNKALARFPNEDCYAVLADDVLPRTEAWDARLKAACLPNGIAWGDDGQWGIKLCTHMFMAGDLARAIGWIGYPGVKHFAADNMWYEIGLALGTGRYLRDVKLEHLHPALGKAEMDDTYRNRPNQRADALAFDEFFSSGGFQLLNDRLTLQFFPESPKARSLRGVHQQQQ